MKKMKQVLAWIGILVLVGLYLITFLLGITGNESTQGMLMASIACTVIVPCLMYAMLLIAKILASKDDSDKNESSKDS